MSFDSVYNSLNNCAPLQENKQTISLANKKGSIALTLHGMTVFCVHITTRHIGHVSIGLTE